MNTLLNFVTINGVDNALDAGDWCKQNIDDSDWNIDMVAFGRPEYTFSFSDSETANWFSLKWSQ